MEAELTVEQQAAQLEAKTDDTSIERELQEMLFRVELLDGRTWQWGMGDTSAAGNRRCKAAIDRTPAEVLAELVAVDDGSFTLEHADLAIAVARALNNDEGEQPEIRRRQFKFVGFVVEQVDPFPSGGS